MSSITRPLAQSDSQDHSYADTGKDILVSLDEAQHFTQWLYSEIKPFISGSILEIGSGLGTYSKKLLRDFPSERIVLSEIDQGYCHQLREQFSNNPHIAIQSIDIEKPIISQQINEQFDTVIALNVMEHIADDATAFNYVYDTLRPGGAFIVLVPAHNFLFNAIDASVGHFRRYNTKLMKQTISKTLFNIEKSFYFNFLSIVGWYVNGSVFKKKTINEGALGLFNVLVPIIKFCERIILRKKLGISLIVVLRKPLI
jgi:SAM-dependent methyltransferase